MTEELPRRWRCKECGTISLDKDLLTAPNPFNADDTLTGCPECRCIAEFDYICQADGCEAAAVAGVAGWRGHRYASVCSAHAKEPSE